METQNELKLGIGTKDIEVLKPAIVKIEKVEIIELPSKKEGQKKPKKLICHSKHPDSAKLVQISSVKYEKKEALKTDGLWFNLDSDGLIKKNSAIAILLQSVGCKTIEELQGKEISTIPNEAGYLCFKAY